MKNAAHTLGFAAVLGLICSLLLFGVNGFTRPYREANEKAERIRNFLAALDAPIGPGTSSADMVAFFEAHVREEIRNNVVLYSYVPKDADAPVALAAPFAGAGVWGPIEGVLALEPDMVTIRGIRFYKQEETPGLGGEIASERFLNLFPGKKIVSRSGQAGFRVRKAGTVSDQNAVDAITGATMTSDRVETMLDTLARRLRGEGGK